MSIGLAVLLAAPPLPRAQPTGADARPFKPDELEQIVAPIALYPDPLVAQIFMASTYPIEVIQATRLVKSKPDLKDAALNEELKKYDWDDSVKSLCSFSQVLQLMHEKIDWMLKLGDAFLGQRKETMDAIQRLRAKAQADGNLKSNEQQKVIVENAAPRHRLSLDGRPRGSRVSRPSSRSSRRTRRWFTCRATTRPLHMGPGRIRTIRRTTRIRLDTCSGRT